MSWSSSRHRVCTVAFRGFRWARAERVRWQLLRGWAPTWSGFRLRARPCAGWLEMGEFGWAVVALEFTCGRKVSFCRGDEHWHERLICTDGGFGMLRWKWGGCVTADGVLAELTRAIRWWSGPKGLLGVSIVVGVGLLSVFWFSLFALFFSLNSLFVALDIFVDSTYYISF